jgi:hypothetical protein
MTMELDAVAETVGTAVELSDVAIIAGGLAVFSATVAVSLVRERTRSDLAGLYRIYRQGVGRAILLGLEFLSPATSSAPSRSHPRCATWACSPASWRSARS